MKHPNYQDEDKEEDDLERNEGIDSGQKMKFPRMTPNFGLFLGELICVVVPFILDRRLGAVSLYLAVGGNGKIWFERNAYFYTQGAAVFNGVVWGIIMGGIYVALINLLHLSKGWMIFLLIWGFLGVWYSGFSAKAKVPEFLRDGAYINLSIIQITSTLIYLLISIISYSVYRPL